jgi:hypothetical protein
VLVVERAAAARDADGTKQLLHSLTTGPSKPARLPPVLMTASRSTTQGRLRQGADRDNEAVTLFTAIDLVTASGEVIEVHEHDAGQQPRSCT